MPVGSFEFLQTRAEAEAPAAVGIGDVQDMRSLAHLGVVQFATAKRRRECLALSASSIIATA